jgi:hypothetical protein
MSTVALSSTVKSAADGDTYVSSAQTYPTQCYLASDFDQNDVVRFEATSSGTIEVLSATGRRVGFVPGYSSAVAVQHGDNDTDGWVLTALPTASPAALVANATDLATAETLVNAIKTIMLNCGLMKAE